MRSKDADDTQKPSLEQVLDF